MKKKIASVSKIMSEKIDIAHKVKRKKERNV